MNRISPHGKPTTPRLRPVKTPPCKPNGRLIKSQVGGTNKEEANSDNRSTTGDPGLNENLGTLVTPEQRYVTAPPDTSTSPLKTRVSSRSGQKGSYSHQRQPAQVVMGIPVKTRFQLQIKAKTLSNDNRTIIGPYMAHHS